MRVTTDDAYKIANGSSTFCSRRVKKATAADLEEIRRDMVDQSVLEPASEED